MDVCLYGNCCVVDTSIKCRVTIIWKGIYAPGRKFTVQPDKASNVILPSKSMFSSNCTDWQEV